MNPTSRNQQHLCAKCENPTSKPLPQSLETLPDNSLLFCNKCSTFYFQPHQDTIKLIRLSQTKYALDVNPLTIYQEKIAKSKQNYKTIFSSWYTQIRISQINFIQALRKRFHASEQTWYSAIEYIDTIFPQYPQKLSSHIISMLTLCSFLLAYKFFELNSNATYIDYYYEFNRMYDINEIFRYEVVCLEKLNYNLSKTTWYETVSLISSVGVFFDYEFERKDMALLPQMHQEISDAVDDIVLNTGSKQVYESYDYMQIAFSLLYLKRQEYGFNGKTTKSVIFKTIFGCEYTSYVDCMGKLINGVEKENTTLKGDGSTNNMNKEEMNAGIEAGKCHGRKNIHFKSHHLKNASMGSVLKLFSRRNSVLNCPQSTQGEQPEQWTKQTQGSLALSTSIKSDWILKWKSQENKMNVISPNKYKDNTRQNLDTLPTGSKGRRHTVTNNRFTAAKALIIEPTKLKRLTIKNNKLILPKLN